MSLHGVPPQVIAYIIVSVLPALIAFSLLIAIARIRTSHLWLVPGWLAAAALAPAVATFFAVRLLISAFSALATSGGGLSVVCAGMWEALQPALFAAYAACALTLITVVISVRAVVNADSESEGTSRSATVTAISVLLFAFATVAVDTQLFRNVSGTIVDIIDPNGPKVLSIAQTSQWISSHLILTAAMGVATSMALIAAVVITAVMNPKSEPSKQLGLIFTFASVLAFIGSIVLAISTQAWCERMSHAAMTGQIVR